MRIRPKEPPVENFRLLNSSDARGYWGLSAFYGSKALFKARGTSCCGGTLPSHVWNRNVASMSLFKPA